LYAYRTFKKSPTQQRADRIDKGCRLLRLWSPGQRDRDRYVLVDQRVLLGRERGVELRVKLGRRDTRLDQEGQQRDAVAFSLPAVSSEVPSNSSRDNSAARRDEKKARLLVDESLGVAVTEVIRGVGWNVLDASEVGLTGHPDENVFAHALKDDRVLLTHDEDFLDDRKFPFDNNRNPGVIVLPTTGGNSALIRAINLALQVCGARELFRGAKVSISRDNVITIRQRNLETGAIETTKYRSGRHQFEKWAD
jgi:predicted nuclease of predicted toxin-antitoxin system